MNAWHVETMLSCQPPGKKHAWCTASHINLFCRTACSKIWRYTNELNSSFPVLAENIVVVKRTLWFHYATWTRLDLDWDAATFVSFRRLEPSGPYPFWISWPASQYERGTRAFAFRSCGVFVRCWWTPCNLFRRRGTNGGLQKFLMSPEVFWMIISA